MVKELRLRKMDLSKSQLMRGQYQGSNSDLFVQSFGFLLLSKSPQEESPGCCNPRCRGR